MVDFYCHTKKWYYVAQSFDRCVLFSFSLKGFILKFQTHKVIIMESIEIDFLQSSTNQNVPTICGVNTGQHSKFIFYFMLTLNIF